MKLKVNGRLKDVPGIRTRSRGQMMMISCPGSGFVSLEVTSRMTRKGNVKRKKNCLFSNNCRNKNRPGALMSENWSGGPVKNGPRRSVLGDRVTVVY